MLHRLVVGFVLLGLIVALVAATGIVSATKGEGGVYHKFVGSGNCMERDFDNYPPEGQGWQPGPCPESPPPPDEEEEDPGEEPESTPDPTEDPGEDNHPQPAQAPLAPQPSGAAACADIFGALVALTDARPQAFHVVDGHFVHLNIVSAQPDPYLAGDYSAMLCNNAVPAGQQVIAYVLNGTEAAHITVENRDGSLFVNSTVILQPDLVAYTELHH